MRLAALVARTPDELKSWALSMLPLVNVYVTARQITSGVFKQLIEGVSVSFRRGQPFTANQGLKLLLQQDHQFEERADRGCENSIDLILYLNGQATAVSWTPCDELEFM